MTSTPGPKPVLVDLALVSGGDQKWIWPHRIPRKRVTIFTGLPGVGKTLVLLDIAKRICQDEGFPDGEVTEPGRVLYIEGENGEEELKRRLEAMGFTAWDAFRLMCDVEETVAGAVTKVPFSLDKHWDALVKAIDDFHPSLVVFDPLIAFHSRNEIKATEMRKMLSDFTRLAEEKDLGIILVQHPNKDYKAPDSLRVRGSGDIVAAARAVILIKMDDEEQGIRLFTQTKLNIGVKPSDLLFKIIDGVVVWLGVAPNVGGGNQLDKAKVFLRFYLGSGPKPVAGLRWAHKLESYSWETVERGKRALKVVATKRGKHWYWALPPSAAGPAGSTHDHLDHVDILDDVDLLDHLPHDQDEDDQGNQDDQDHQENQESRVPPPPSVS